jgi:hypothetical protein
MNFVIEVGEPRKPIGRASLSTFLSRIGVAEPSESPIRLERDGLEGQFQISKRGSRIWKEEANSARNDSFVYVAGWCYRISSSEQEVGEGDLAGMLARHRAGLPPADPDFSGNCIVIAYDSGSGRVAVQPDHYGWSAVYFAEEGGRIVISNRAALVAASVEAPFDGYSVMSLLRGTHYPFGRTLFGGVRRVLSGCYLEVEPARRRVTSRRSVSLFAPTRSVKRSEAVALVADTVESLARRLTGGEETVFDLTGGMDTRLLAAGIRRENPPGIGDRFTWSVMGPADLPDVSTAQRVAESLGWPLRRFDRVAPRDCEASELERYAILSDGALTIDAAFNRLTFEAEQGGEWGRAGGMGGELLRGWLWGQEFLALGVTSRVNFEALKEYRIRPSRAFGGDAIAPGWPRLEDHDEVLLKPYRDIGAAGGDRRNAYKLDVMAQHKLIYLAYNWLAGVRRVRLPFVTWEFSSVVLSLPWRFRVTRRLLLQTFARLSPELTRIPTSKGEPMTPLDLSSLPLYGRRAVSELLRGVPFVVRRLLGPGRSKNGAAAPVVPSSWIPLLRESQAVASFISPAFVHFACSQSAVTSDSVRAFYTLLTLALLTRGIPTLRPEIAFRETAGGVTS